MGRIKFLRRFIPKLDELIKTITNMLKVGNKVKWKKESKQYFEALIISIGEELVLIIHDYSKTFLIFSFASTYTVVVVML